MTELVRKNNKWQKKLLTADSTTDETMTDLTFSNLIIGKQYKVTLQARILAVSGDNVGAFVRHNGVTIAAVQSGDNATSTAAFLTVSSTSVIFTAVVSTVIFDSVSLTAGSSVQGNTNFAETWSMIEELEDYNTETTDFT